MEPYANACKSGKSTVKDMIRDRRYCSTVRAPHSLPYDCSRNRPAADPRACSCMYRMCMHAVMHISDNARQFCKCSPVRVALIPHMLIPSLAPQSLVAVARSSATCPPPGPVTRSSAEIWLLSWAGSSRGSRGRQQLPRRRERVPARGEQRRVSVQQASLRRGCSKPRRRDHYY